MAGRAAQRTPDAAPRRTVPLVHAVALVVGVVVGAGIFRAPSAVAAAAGGERAALLAWVLGGVVSLAGAACYAELASAFPHPGGDYHFLRRALGRAPAFLFAWARLTVIPTGSVALLAFVTGDYLSKLLPLGPHSSAAYAAIVVVLLTALNAAGVRTGARVQSALTALAVLGLVALSVGGLALPPAPPAPAPPPAPGGLSAAMVFVLLTYGGWNEAAYLSAELRGGRRAIATALAASLALVTALYVLANAAYLHALGLAGAASSEAIGADLAARVLGGGGAAALSVVVAAATLTSANATLLLGSRACYAFGRDTPLFGWLGRWSGRAETPVNAVLAQGGIALVLVGFGAVSRSGFEAMVAYVAPVFWLFFLLTGISLFVLRAKEPRAERPFRVPLYPLTPAVFCASSAWLLWSSLAYTGAGAALGVAVVACGLVPLWLASHEPAARPGRAGVSQEEHA